MYKSILLLALVASSLAATIQLTARIRDFTPQTCPGDFEGAINGLVTGLVSANLVGGKPVASAPGNFFCFDKWYVDVNNINSPIDITLTLDDSAQPGLFTFESNAFFPIDGQGFGNFFGNRNFHFTTEVSTVFTYNASQTNTFSFFGDDDVWVFVNGKLAVDLGGVHGQVLGSVDLNAQAANFGLVDGQDATLHIFHAERHTSQSNFKMTTTLKLVAQNPEDPPTHVIDLCGVFVPTNCNLDPNCPFKTTPKFSFPSGFDAPAVTQYNAIVFQDFQANTGDTEGRVAAGRDFQAGQGYSVGDKVLTVGANKILDYTPFSLIAGRDATWGCGSVGPFAPNPSAPEDVYAGRNANLGCGIARRTIPNFDNNVILNDFTFIQQYYSFVSQKLAALSNNANVAKDQGRIFTITCQDANADQYVATFDASIFSGITDYEFSGCNVNAQFIFNVNGNGDVTFPLNTFEPVPADFAVRRVAIAYNILGSRNVNVNSRLVGHIIAPTSNLIQTDGVIQGLVVAATYSVGRNGQAASQINLPRCPAPPVVNPPPQPPATCPYFEEEGDCSLGLRFGDTLYSFRDYNAVSFGDFNASTGDVEGRLIVQRNLNLGAGYSVGDKVNTANGKDNFVPYSLVVGGDASWGSGALFPDVSPPAPNQGEPEGLFVGGTFTAPSYLQLRRTPTGLSNNLAGDFANALTCYNSISAALAAKTQNVDFSVANLGLQIVCSASLAEYVLNVDASVLNSITWYNVHSSCNPGAKWVINVLGSGTVNFGGDNIPGISGGITYNVVGSGRTINVNTRVNGNLLAPRNTLNQRGGVIVGKVVVGTVQFALQINEANCPDFIEPIEIPQQTGGECEEGDDHVPCSEDCGQYQPGDEVEFPGGDKYKIKEVHEDEYHLESSLQNNYQAGVRTIVKVIDPVSRSQQSPTPDNSGAMSNVASVALIVALIALLL